MSLHLSLRAKGLAAVALLLAYLAGIGLFLANERQKLGVIMRDMEVNQIAQATIGSVVQRVAQSLVQVQTVLNSAEYASHHPIDADERLSELRPVGKALLEAQRMYPFLGPDIANLRNAMTLADASAVNAALPHVRDSEQEIIAKLHAVLSGLERRSRNLSNAYQDQQQFISAFAIGANLVGAVASVAVILMFFSRLAKDIRSLQDRAVAVVGGYDGPPLTNTRGDEVGALIDAVNRMQTDLRTSERQVEINRQQRFHQEKMAAVGSLAAAISHEVSNPIAAISGVAQFIVDETRDANDPTKKPIHAFATQILHQADRITLIMRQMATLTAPNSPVPELLDVNALIRSTSAFIRYDRRFRGIEFEEDLDHDLPAVTAVGDHLTQVLMNLLINAADAMEGLPAERRRIRIASRVAGDEVHLTVTDQGQGMTPEVLARAFDESFTTKPVGKGRGIGLFICKSLIEQGRGRITFESQLGAGTTAHVFLPLRTAADAAAPPAAGALPATAEAV